MDKKDLKNLHAVNPQPTKVGGNTGDTNDGKPFENVEGFDMAEATADQENGPGVGLGEK